MTVSPINVIENYQFLPIPQAVAPSGGTYFQHFTDCWWAVHPEKGLAFWNPKNSRTGRRREPGYGAPQCNTSEQISRAVCEKTITWPVEVRKLASVWVPVSINDCRQ